MDNKVKTGVFESDFPREANEVLLRDPLSPSSRARQRNVLISSSVGLLINFAGLVPTKIAALGIDLSITERASLLKCLSVVILYQTLSFMISVRADHLVWKIECHKAHTRDIEATGQESANTPEGARKRELASLIQGGPFRIGPRLWIQAKATSEMRRQFDYKIPVIFGLISAIILFYARP